MDRRTVLSGMLISLSGCMGITASPNESADTRKKATSEFPSIDITGISGLQGLDAELTVSVLQQASSDEPGSIQIAVENIGEESMEVTGGPSPPFNSMSAQGSKTSSRLYLVSEDEVGVASDEPVIPKKSRDGCWNANTKFSVYEMAHGATIPPGEELSRDYAVLAGPEYCLQPGEYTLTDSLIINDSEVKLSFALKIAEK